MQSFKLKFLGVTILQGVKFPIFLLIFEWALQQCSATALPVMVRPHFSDLYIVILNVYIIVCSAVCDDFCLFLSFFSIFVANKSIS